MDLKWSKEPWKYRYTQEDFLCPRSVGRGHKSHKRSDGGLGERDGRATKETETNRLEV
jgi:hypothetical protein